MNEIPPLRGISYVRELREVGDDDRPLRRAVRVGEMVRIHRGAFMTMNDWMSLDRVQRHRHQAVAATRAGRSNPTLSHRSAAVLWGVPLLDRPPHVVDVLSTLATGTRTEGGYSRHATAHPDLDIDQIGGVRITGFVRTLAEYAAQAPHVDAVVALDWAFRPTRPDAPKPVTDGASVLAMAEALGIRRGLRRIRRAVDFADGQSGSPGESASRVAMHVIGAPRPELQVEFRDRRGRIGFVDFWWPELGIIGEFDGLVKYTDQRFTGGAPIEDIVIAEKKREDRLRGLPQVNGVVRWLWAEATVPRALAGQLRVAGVPVRYPG